MGTFILNPYIFSGLTVTYLGITSSSSNLTTYNFTSFSLGAESSDRYIIVGLGEASAGGSPITLSSGSINGVSATIINSYSPDASNDYGTAFMGAAVPSGTSGTISATWSSTAARCGISVWSVTGGLLSLTPTATTQLATTNPNTTIAISAGGFALIAQSYAGGTHPPTGGGDFTRDSGVNMESSQYLYGWRSAVYPSGTTASINITTGGASAGLTTNAVAFR
jgi:hypothetical protein